MIEGTALKLQYLEDSYETLTNLDGNQEHTVFLVKGKSDGKIYVKKIVSPEAAVTCQKLKGLKNRNIAEIFHAAWNEEKGIVIEEFVNGVTMGEYLERWGLLKERRVCGIVLELSNALFDIHNLGIVHRDIKPENIMLSNDNVIKLIDFGIARTRKEDGKQDTEILGTVGYAAPEQFGYTQTDARADIYAIGVLMNKLLTGKLPTQNLYEVQPVRGIIKRCIEIDAKNRFQTIQELKRTIETAMVGSSSVPNVHLYPDISKGAVYQERKRNETGCVIKGIPGFRTGVLWKNVVATMGYLFLILGTFVWMSNFTSSVGIFLAGGLAVFLYAWVATLIGFNIFYWDRKLYPVRLLPKQVMLVVRIALWLVIFSIGVTLEGYLKYDVLGMTRIK